MPFCCCCYYCYYCYYYLINKAGGAVGLLHPPARGLPRNTPAQTLQSSRSRKFWKVPRHAHGLYYLEVQMDPAAAAASDRRSETACAGRRAVVQAAAAAAAESAAESAAAMRGGARHRSVGAILCR